MRDESTRQAAQEYLDTRLTEEGQSSEDRLNTEAAVALAPVVWKRVLETLAAMCEEWNSITKEQTLTCKETVLGDLRIRCAGRSQQLIVHFESKKGFVKIENSAREEHEPEVILLIQGYPTDSGREAHLVRNNEPVNLEMLLLGQLRVLSGLSRRAED